MRRQRPEGESPSDRGKVWLVGIGAVLILLFAAGNATLGVLLYEGHGKVVSKDNTILGLDQGIAKADHQLGTLGVYIIESNLVNCANSTAEALAAGLTPMACPTIPSSISSLFHLSPSP